MTTTLKDPVLRKKLQEHTEEAWRHLSALNAAVSDEAKLDAASKWAAEAVCLRTILDAAAARD